MWTADQWRCYLLVGLDITQPAILSGLRHLGCVKRMRALLRSIIAYNKANYKIDVYHLGRPSLPAYVMNFTGSGVIMELGRRSINRCLEMWLRRHSSPIGRVQPTFQNVGWRIDDLAVHFFFLSGWGKKPVEITETQFFNELERQGIVYK
jgi:hypothetical protein